MHSKGTGRKAVGDPVPVAVGDHVRGRPISGIERSRHTSNRCLNVSVTFSRVTSMADKDTPTTSGPAADPAAPRRRGRPRASDVAAQLAGTGSVTPFPEGPADDH